ncbi:hypothetical protein PR202_ga16234 [Eleusine coracana subsp. coracana]|uniref:Uncharacterized protein n=1 Tax=Eleusine coracana subsp. coracana TaxID=191504 RepID=A0AAV5CLW3_ELECO|nr:hypothetical protein PR202_ga16234 [Eleusine coracana subsp. coracana]
MDGPTRPTPRIKSRCPHRIPLSLSSVHFSLAVVVFLAAHCKHLLLPSFPSPVRSKKKKRSRRVGLLRNLFARFSVSIYGLVTTWVAVGLSVLRVSSILDWKEGTLGLQSPWRPLLSVWL